MNPRVFVPVILFLGIVIAIAGCTAPQASPVPATPVTASPAAPPAAAGTNPAVSGPSLVPGTTDSLGAARSVTVDISKDYLGIVHATFQGGPGLSHVKKIDVTLNRADGQVKTATVGTLVGDTAELEGTKQTDRVMVSVTLDDGKIYTIYDELIAFKPRP
jgi:hypothetical protein